jgi:hypothetical protein
VAQGSTSDGDEGADEYLELAREIRAEVARVAADDDAGTAALEEVFAGITDRERGRRAREVFDRLPVERQWAVVERVFDDDELAEALAGHRQALLAAAERRAVAAGVADGTRLDTVRVPTDGRLALGLFKEDDVATAAERGPSATTCVRRVELRSSDAPGAFQVIEDVFNPLGGYFVTADYDDATWRRDRLPGHAIVRPGSIVPEGAEARLDPVLHLGGRVDVEVDGDLRIGRLHLGWATLDGVDLFERAAR